MKLSSGIASVCCALIVGAVGGAFSAHWYFHRQPQPVPPDWLYVTYTGQVVRDMNLVSQLRRGATEETVGDLEDYLAMNLYDLARQFPERALSNSRDLRTLKAVARYNSEYSLKTGNPARDQVVQDFLARADKHP